LVGGRNRTQSWQDGEITRYSTEIVFNPRDGATINLISDKRQDAPVSIAPAAQQPEQSTGQPVAQSVPPIIQNMEVLDFDDMDYDAMFDHNPAQ
jgi:hypothetical protein